MGREQWGGWAKSPMDGGLGAEEQKTVMYAIRVAIRTASPSRFARHSRPVLCRRRKAAVDQRGRV